MDTHSPEGYYRTLGLAPGASLEEVKRAYRELVKVWHPDRFARAPHLQQQALEKIQLINHAYTRLRFLRPDLVTPPLPMPPWLWALRQARRIRALPPWLVALVAFAVLRLGFEYLALLPPAPVLSHPGRLVEEQADRVEQRGIPPAWETPHSRFLSGGEGIEAEAATPRSSPPDRSAPPDQANSYFTVGSTKDDVLVVQGTPTRFSERVWEYGHARVYFEADRVTRWEEWRGSPLKARYVLQEED